KIAIEHRPVTIGLWLGKNGSGEQKERERTHERSFQHDRDTRSSRASVYIVLSTKCRDVIIRGMTARESVPQQVNPGRLHQALTSYQLAMALKGAIELEIFTHIAAGAGTPSKIAPLCGGTEKGVRVLCDYLTVHGFLTKANNTYSLVPDTAPLL